MICHGSRTVFQLFLFNISVTQTLHIITGTTAVGKTEYALSYAEEHNAEIISCDASLFYRGMDIGTAKPTPEERVRVPHHMIDICEVHEPYDVTVYIQDARRAVEDIHSRAKNVVVTGGSGFYLKSFLAPVTDDVVVPDAIRRESEKILSEDGLPGLLKELYQLNPGGVSNLDIRNPRRVIRALERCMATGKNLSELQAQFNARPVPYSDYEKRVILLERDQELLGKRIEQRVELMIQNGLVEEVRGLMDQGIEENPSAASAIGYRETIACLSGDLTEAELAPAIIKNTLHLAKKQRTWFRTQINEPDIRIQL